MRIQIKSCVYEYNNLNKNRKYNLKHQICYFAAKLNQKQNKGVINYLMCMPVYYILIPHTYWLVAISRKHIS